MRRSKGGGSTMKRDAWSRVVLGGLVALGGVWSVSDASAAAAAGANGQEVYELKCMTCHGQTGRGDGPTANALNKKPQDFAEAGFFAARPDADLKTTIVSGKTPMPAFRGKLKAKEIEAVIAYIKSLGTKK